MDSNITQIAISVVTILLSIGGSVVAFVYNAGRQSKAIENLKSSIDRIDDKVNKVDEKTDKLSDNLLIVSKELSYLKGLFDAERLAKK